MSFTKQTTALVAVALVSTRDHWGSAAVIAIGIGSAVGVLIAALSIGAGMEMMAMKNVRADRAVVRTAGEMVVDLPREAAASIAGLPGIKRDADGKPLVSADARVVVQVRSKEDGVKSSVTIVGVSSKYQKVYPEIRITAGRSFQPGINEIIVGKNAQQSYRNLELGNELRYQGTTWKVVGSFEADAGLAETWLLTDAETLRSAFNRQGFAHMTVLLDSSASFDALSGALRAAPVLNAQLESEAKVRSRQSRSLAGIVNFVSYFLGSIMAIGAMMGALNSMYMMIDARRREFATLRAMGFMSRAIALAVLVEALLLAIPGAIAGVLLPWVLFNGNEVRFVGLNFSLAVTPHLAALGVAWAFVIGMVGAAVPAFRAARIPIAAGVRTG